MRTEKQGGCGLVMQSPLWGKRNVGGASAACSRWSVLRRPLKEVICELGGSEGRDTGGQAKIWGKTRAKQQHKDLERSRVWLKQHGEPKRDKKLPTAET